MEQQLWILLDVLIAAGLSGVIGFEREWAGKPAGLRTHMIIGGAAALLVSLGEILSNSYLDSAVSNLVRTDPLRIVEAIIVGISFIGAGTVLKSERKQTIFYLTTAASILFSAGVGIAVSLKQYILAIGLTLAIFIINHMLNWVEEKFIKKENQES